jgi:hypothetical protein
MFDLKNFKMDDDKKVEGVWVDFGSGAKFKIAALNNDEFVREYTKRSSAYTALGREMPEDEVEEVVIELMAAYVVLDWEGVYLDEKVLKCTPDNAAMVLKTFDPVRERIIKEARSLENFVDDQKEVIEKN